MGVEGINPHTGVQLHINCVPSFRSGVYAAQPQASTISSSNPCAPVFSCFSAIYDLFARFFSWIGSCCGLYTTPEKKPPPPPQNTFNPWKNIDLSKDICAVCQEIFTAATMILPCHHVFDGECIATATACPTCRSPINMKIPFVNNPITLTVSHQSVKEPKESIFDLTTPIIGLKATFLMNLGLQKNPPLSPPEIDLCYALYWIKNDRDKVLLIGKKTLEQSGFSEGQSYSLHFQAKTGRCCDPCFVTFAVDACTHKS